MTLRHVAEISFPTRWAHFRLMGFESSPAKEDNLSMAVESALALVLGDIHTQPPLVRIHSQCMTGDVFHSLRCDCHDQLDLALHTIAQEGVGVLLYEHQEGRGIGLMEKLRAYALQEQGLDTIDANLSLGYAADLRNYQLSVQILHFLGLKSLRLMTNNPEKFEAVVASGIQVAERVSAEVHGNPHSARYLLTKRERLGHLIGAGPQAAAPAPPAHGQVYSTSVID